MEILALFKKSSYLNDIRLQILAIPNKKRNDTAYVIWENETKVEKRMDSVGDGLKCINERIKNFDDKVDFFESKQN